MTYYEFFKKVSQYQRENPSQRIGQVYFNVVHEIAPDAADKCRATRDDPFHDDSRVGVFLVKVAPLIPLTSE